ncbi:MAG TPA: crotonase/enoyl-CoA hydratase family protein [Burkholderiales bacterium]|nr:crotonase/enoyl-CoA hydratase family protein [Burkholderiales bacterium]
MSASAEVKLLRAAAHYNQVETRFDAELGVYWALMAPRPRPCFSIQLLADLHSYITTITTTGAHIHVGSEVHRIAYGVLASSTSGVFNLGGDLALFRMFIHNQDRQALLDYGRKCVDNLLAWHRNCDGLITSIALVQGEALGGGFEAALSASVLIAEESSRLGFPEILFNLFPGMGAYSFLSRKIGRRAAEEMITSGTIYSARQLYDLGVIDILTPDGTGEAAVQSFIRRHSKSANGRRGFERARNEVVPVTEEELLRVVDIWADTALKLQERDLKVMERLIRAQARNAESQTQADGRNVVPMHAMAASDRL